RRSHLRRLLPPPPPRSLAHSLAAPLPPRDELSLVRPVFRRPSCASEAGCGRAFGLALPRSLAPPLRARRGCPRPPKRRPRPPTTPLSFNIYAETGWPARRPGGSRGGRFASDDTWHFRSARHAGAAATPAERDKASAIARKRQPGRRSECVCREEPVLGRGVASRGRDVLTARLARARRRAAAWPCVQHRAEERTEPATKVHNHLAPFLPRARRLADPPTRRPADPPPVSESPPSPPPSTPPPTPTTS
ncbi:serine/arginine repetitive matrix protein 1-like, partial [Penaeus japonicus]|uniref:serine/arginine repetitive matrix protein 1-like n=1 Tax=Penaeus japonicus TaxID=27405 RepID=UPI001C7152DF